MEKWQEQVEEILREHYQGDESSKWSKMTKEILEFTRKVEIPPGDVGQFLDRVLNIASEKNRPCMVAHIGFKLGVAYERYQNAKQEA